MNGFASFKCLWCGEIREIPFVEETEVSLKEKMRKIELCGGHNCYEDGNRHGKYQLIGWRKTNGKTSSK